MAGALPQESFVRSSIGGRAIDFAGPVWLGVECCSLRYKRDSRPRGQVGCFVLLCAGIKVNKFHLYSRLPHLATSGMQEIDSEHAVVPIAYVKCQS